MRPVLIEDLLTYRFLSDVRIAPNGKRAAFTLRQANGEENNYRSDLYVVELDGKRVSQLTSSGQDGPFAWSPNGEEILFISHRTGSKDESPLYRIKIRGGEGKRIGVILHKVETLRTLNARTILFTARTSLADEGTTENAADYEVLDEIPFWQNGQGFTNKRRMHLFRYDLETGREKDLIEPQLEVISFDVNDNRVALVARRFPGKAPPTSELWFYDLDTGKAHNISKDKYSFSEVQFLSQDRLVVLGTNMKRYGRNQNKEVMMVNLETGGIVSLTPGWDRSIGDLVNSDCRFGKGPASCVDSGRVYTIITERNSVSIDAIDYQGNVERIVNVPGSVDWFDVRVGRIVYVSLRENRLQELYSFDEGKEHRLSTLNEGVLAERTLASPKPFTATGKDGTMIDAWILPPTLETGRKYPTILAIHGGPKFAHGTVFFHEMQALAAAGYVVLFSNPRGSAGRGDTFADIRERYGTIDYDDLMAVVDHALSSFSFIDPARLGVMGGSYGGFMTNWIIGHTDRFRAACSQRSIANWISRFCTTDIGYLSNKDQIGKTPWEADGSEKLWWHSPLRYAHKTTTPTLFIHSEEDYRCCLVEGLQMFTALRYHGVESRLVLFHGENHELSRSGKPQHRLRRLQEILSWFDKYLKNSKL